MPHTLDLFADSTTVIGNAADNYLPCDGEVYYYGKILTASTAAQYLQCLLQQIAWQHDRAVIYGREHITARQVAWYGDQAFSYRYSGTEKVALAWITPLLELKQLVEQQCQSQFNACLLNLYANGSQGMAWHRDAETQLQAGAAIASLSLGAERKFSFKHRLSQQKVDLYLENGSLLLMAGATQQHWLHRLPPSQKISQPRLSLTFRCMRLD
ncbi:alpha-ketoglutarate-dependent dioxygenase AlkB family protein [Acinetobacter larvae]|uniref:Alpha-ketoglutarate-dependent dioxygenase AlkB n=1 Tax=Acinetobacter larvae TaxID=1789224 RepID=A0A1B2M238_9GAMM|nr:alpha-ketoglutarate-dependent dioxygenase AlkB [Acinetobacter larvae]AOA59265.1 alpha-ketoglutarate-dependent dioxygenase AlkB [Acinetobacter larvae]